MTMNARSIFKWIVWVLVLFAKPVFAQEFSDDAAIWTNFYFEKKVSDKWTIHLNQQNRINENVTRFNLAYADVGVTYKLNKYASVMGDYVFSQNRKFDLSFKSRHQGYVALMLHARMGRWRFNYRNMFQSQVEEYFSSEKGKVPEYYERNKVTVKYDLNKYVSLYSAQEIYYPLYQEKNKGFDRSRTFAGMFYNLNKQMQIELYFLFQRELNAFDATRRVFVYGLGYSYEF